jgi:hypothetical protein
MNDRIPIPAFSATTPARQLASRIVWFTPTAHSCSHVSKGNVGFPLCDFAEFIYGEGISRFSASLRPTDKGVRETNETNRWSILRKRRLN